jgi:hypothetical protein
VGATLKQQRRHALGHPTTGCEVKLHDRQPPSLLAAA